MRFYTYKTNNVQRAFRLFQTFDEAKSFIFGEIGKEVRSLNNYTSGDFVPATSTVTEDENFISVGYYRNNSLIAKQKFEIVSILVG